MSHPATKYYSVLEDKDTFDDAISGPLVVIMFSGSKFLLFEVTIHLTFNIHICVQQFGLFHVELFQFSIIMPKKIRQPLSFGLTKTSGFFSLLTIFLL